MSSPGQRDSVGQKLSITGFLDKVGHLGGVDHDQLNYFDLCRCSGKYPVHFLDMLVPYFFCLDLSRGR